MNKKLLHLSANQYDSNNIDHHSGKIWKELSQEFSEYHLLTRSKDNKFHKYTNGNITLHQVPRFGNRARSYIISSIYIFRIIQKFKITHLLSQSAIFGGFSALFASKYFKIPLMIEIHGEEYFKIMESEKLAFIIPQKFLKYIYKNSTRVRSLNSKMTYKLANHGIVDNVIEIPGRVDLNLFNLRKTDYEINLPLRLISVGRFVKEKNYKNLLIHLKETGLNFHITLIGGGPLKQSYLDIIQHHKLESRVKLIDWVDQKKLKNEIINADIYIQYSISEGMPRTILESMAMAMPIITTDVGSISGIIKDDYNGLLVKTNNSDHLKETLIKLSTNKNKRKNIAFNAYNDVLENYEWSLVFNKYRRTLAAMEY